MRPSSLSLSNLSPGNSGILGKGREVGGLFIFWREGGGGGGCDALQVAR